jgi:hypothetical protein
MDLSISTTQGGKAAAASTRAKRGFLVLCVLLAAAMYVSQERSRAQADARLGGASPEMHALAARFSQPGDAAALTVRKLFYDRQDGVYCGEVNGRTSGGAEVRFRDGVRIFVCSPGLRD